MPSSLLGFFAIFVIACWIFVIGHQLSWPAFDASRYGFLQGAIYISYPIAFMSAAVAGAVVVLAVFKK